MMNRIAHVDVLDNSEQGSNDYIASDGLLYCGTCHTPKEAYFPEGKTFFGRDRHPMECDCQKRIWAEQERTIKQQEHLRLVSRLKGRGSLTAA